MHCSRENSSIYNFLRDIVLYDIKKLFLWCEFSGLVTGDHRWISQGLRDSPIMISVSNSVFGVLSRFVSWLLG